MGYLDSLPQEFLQADAEGRFSYLAETSHWDANRESVGGHGSTIEKTQQYRLELSDLIRNRSLRSMFDAPCGDYNWMRLVVAETSIGYIGGDICLTYPRPNSFAVVPPPTTRSPRPWLPCDRAATQSDNRDVRPNHRLHLTVPSSACTVSAAG
jgi:hypothetical protein